MLYQPLEALTYTTWALEGAAAGAQRCFEVLDQEEDVKRCAGGEDDHRDAGRDRRSSRWISAMNRRG